MSDKTYPRLSNVSLSEFKNQLIADSVFASLTDSQQTAVINEAVDKYNKLSNELSLDEYIFNAILDADLVLAPTLSSYNTLFSAYCKIKFDAYDAGSTNIISYVAATKVLIYPDEENYEAGTNDPNNVVYTIPMLGATLDKTYKILTPDQSYVYAYLSSNNLIVTVPKSHVAFDIEIEKKKES